MLTHFLPFTMMLAQVRPPAAVTYFPLRFPWHPESAKAEPALPSSDAGAHIVVRQYPALRGRLFNRAIAIGEVDHAVPRGDSQSTTGRPQRNLFGHGPDRAVLGLV
jgi:hypothetical protein